MVDEEPKDCAKYWIEEICEDCDYKICEQVSHPGGASLTTVDWFHCDFGYWEDDF